MTNTLVVCCMKLNKALEPEGVKKTISPEDAALFVELEDEESNVRSSSEPTGSWLRFMEYGDGSIVTPPSSHEAALALTGMEEERSEITEPKLDRIEKSFSHSTPVHRDSPSLVAECVWEVFPEESCCCFDYGLIVVLAWLCDVQHYEGTPGEVDRDALHSTLRIHRSRGETTEHCEQLKACDGTTDEEETLKREWKRSFVGARVNRIKSEARSERVALIWDPSSDGGVARYFPLNDDRIFSLTRCVSDACEL